MPINYYSVANDLESEGWRLISSTYKNLDTELEMECSKGHKQIQTYKQWRKTHTCEQCLAGDPFKGKKNKVPPKKIDTTRILALDAATNVTGYAIYDDEVLVSYGTYKTDGSKDTTARINEFKYWFDAALKEWSIDRCGVENIQLQAFGKGNFQVELYRSLAQLQGVLLDTLFENHIEWELAYSSTWRKYCGVGEDKGRENKKKAAQEKVKLWYNQDCTQDEADAICIGKYFCHYFKNKNQKSSWGEDL